MPADRLSCVVAVLTYLRPSDLRELLPQLLEQIAGVDDDVDILVVDNDPLGSARELVEAFADVGVRYAHEVVPGIAAARNLALDLGASSEVLIFIDDDERPSAQWLSGMLELYREMRPAAVVGPVISDFSKALDPWIEAGRFFRRRRMPTGTAITVAATNNLLLDMAVIGVLGLRFDLAFGISGGSDTLFTRQLTSAGRTILWHDEAVVFDVVPEKRQTRAWVLQRAYRSGNSWSQTALVLETRASTKRMLQLKLSAAGAFRIAGGTAAVVVGVVTRSVGLNARGNRTLQRGAGMMTGAWGHQYLEYRRPDGPAV